MPLLTSFPATRRLFNFAAFLILALAAITVTAGVLIPLYSDEIAVQMVRARFFIEHAQLLNLLPQCDSLLIPTPLSWYPGGTLNAIFYSGASEIGLRARGIALFLTWLTLLWIWAGRHPQVLLPQRGFQTLIISFNMLGVMPFVLLLARSEQLLVLSAIAFCMLPLIWPANTTDSNFSKLLKFVLFWSLTSVFFMAHPKALFFSPLVLVSGWLTFKKSNVFLKAGISAIVLFTVFDSLHYAQSFSKCPNAPLMAQTLAQHTLNFKLLSTDILSFGKAAWHNLFSSLTLILDRVPATSTYQSNWLPSTDNKSFDPFLIAFGHLLKFSLLISILLLLTCFLYRLASQIANKRIGASTFLALALAGGLGVHAAMYNVNAWHFYTPGLVIPLLLILLLLTLYDQTTINDRLRRTATIAASYWFLLALFSMAIILFTVTPQLIKIARMDEHVIPNQPLSTPVFSREKRAEEILGLAAQCDIKDRDERLVLDGEAYFQFQNGKSPVNILYISDYAFGMDIGSKIPEFLKKLNSGGVISRCEYLPKILRDRAITSGTLCCVSRQTWQ